ncbi:MAG: ABC transporter permease subunit [Candidatus Eisenbacteria bacterium]|nr:ABC transporter permease subunit [Candidatus Eisenbacteria bacterium]
MTRRDEGASPETRKGDETPRGEVAGIRAAASPADRAARVDALRRARPQRRFLRFSLFLLGALFAYAWASGAFTFVDLGTERAQRNLTRFLEEIRPYPLQGVPWDFSVYVTWFRDVILPHTGVALLATLALSVAAIFVAAFLGAALAPFAARTLATPSPYLSAGQAPRAATRLFWRGAVIVSRALFVFTRSVPEYVWAFLFLSTLGVGPWPAVLALATHNMGILGRLYAESIENSPGASSVHFRATGASRAQIYFASLLPGALGRYLLYFFYRWETCVREATVLGLLGFVSLGWFIQDARAGVRYDEMFHFILLGSVLIVFGDVVSGWVRKRIRQSV